MRILVTSASGANGNGYGTILGFGAQGEFTGPFSGDPRIADPRGMSLDPSGALVYLNSGDDRILALDLHGYVMRDSGREHDCRVRSLRNAAQASPGHRPRTQPS